MDSPVRVNVPLLLREMTAAAIKPSRPNTHPTTVINEIALKESGNNWGPPWPVFARNNPPTETTMAINIPVTKYVLDFLLSMIFFLLAFISSLQDTENDYWRSNLSSSSLSRGIFMP